MCLPTCNQDSERIEVHDWVRRWKVEELQDYTRPDATATTVTKTLFLVAKYTRPTRRWHTAFTASGFLYGSQRQRDKRGVHVFPACLDPGFMGGEEHKIILAAGEVETLPCSASSGHVIAKSFHVLGCETCTEAFLRHQAGVVQSRFEARLETAVAGTLARCVIDVKKLDETLERVLGAAVLRAQNTIVAASEQAAARLQEEGYTWLARVVSEALNERGIPAHTLLLTLMTEAEQQADATVPHMSNLVPLTGGAKGRRP